MVGRGEITDAAWERIAPLLPEDGRPGGVGGTTAWS
jgi:transposase